MDAEYWRRFEAGVNLLHYYAWWLYYLGLAMLVGSVVNLFLLIMQILLVDGLKTLTSHSNAKLIELRAQLMEIVAQK